MLFMVSCSQGGFQVPIASTITKPETTYSPELPTRTRIGNNDVFDGVSEISNLLLDVKGEESKASLTGTVTIRPVSGNRAPVKIPLSVSGEIDLSNYSAYMHPTNPVQITALGMKVGVKLMCLNEDCTDSFMDIYINYQGHFYRHQVRSTQKVKTSPSPSPSASPEDKEDDKKDEAPVVEPVPKDNPDEDPEADLTSDEPEHETIEEEEGTFVGEPEKDLEVFFPQEIKKTDEPKKTITPPIKLEPPTTIPEDPTIIKKYLDKFSQAFGTPNAGHLQNPVDIYKFQLESNNPGFRVFNPKEKHYFGTSEMLSMIARIGKFSIEKVGYVLSINDISDRDGGRLIISRKPLKFHNSHQNGLDADIAYFFDDPEFRAKGNFVNVVRTSRAKKSWMADKQWELFKDLVSTNMVDRIFTDNYIKGELCQNARRKSEMGSGQGIAESTLKVLKHESGHANHFHLRLKCSTAQPRCRKAIAPANYPLGC
jgi:penicillin-insensitive murein endopeptidase